MIYFKKKLPPIFHILYIYKYETDCLEKLKISENALLTYFTVRYLSTIQKYVTYANLYRRIIVYTQTILQYMCTAV
jgi:hypothetical protein